MSEAFESDGIAVAHEALDRITQGENFSHGVGLPVLIEKGAEVAPKCMKVKPGKWAEQSDNRLSVRLSNALLPG
ncbi:hypothetical protein FHP26_20230 [Pseudomonas orientalis]|nr:hypothetical protein [Pseudomonas orientalis]